jgi:hypothetical protein
LKKKIEAGEYPGIVKTTLDGVNEADFLQCKTDKSARDFFFYYSGAQLAAVRYKDWKFVYYGSEAGAAGWREPLIPYHFTAAARRRGVRPLSDSSIHAGAWSLAFSQPRTSRSTPAVTRRSATTRLSRR